MPTPQTTPQSKPAFTFGTTYKTRGFGYTCEIHPILLEADWNGFPKGKHLGTIQIKQFNKTPGCKTSRSKVNTFSTNAGILGRDPDWVLKEFVENEGGGRQARHDAIQPGNTYVVRRMFGILNPAHEIYNPGDTVKITERHPDHFMTEVSYKGQMARTLRWNRDTFESCVDTYSLTKTE